MIKNNVGKFLTAIVSLLALTAIVVTLTACSSEVLLINENGNYPVLNYGYVSVNVPQETVQSNYDVAINTVESTPTDKTRVEIIEDIRPTVVDVYGYAYNGSSAGSGVIIASTVESDKEYYFIVTNHHVIEGCTSFEASLLFINEETDEETYDTYDATLIGGSPSRDIAVIRIEKKGNETIKSATAVADSDDVKVGMDVIAIGNPLGILGGTVTMGVVSAKAREVSVSDIGTMTLMQTDAAINSGNSGGGLFDENGYLIGVVNSGYSSYEGLNFAIPANDAIYATESLINTYDETSDVPYGYVTGDTEIGITCQTMTLYESNNRNVRNSYVVGITNDNNSLLYSAWGDYYQAITRVSVDYAEDGKETADVSITSMTDMNTIMKTVSAGDVITFKYKSVMTAGSFMNQRQYLNAEEKTVTVTATQYIYTI
ncbi:MAG: trypsin-like peptidase domain-containing protein [Clostridia bacterium]|nr:trypsin-like peptidase domain-containing protein [Clostridia bacterium]